VRRVLGWKTIWRGTEENSEDEEQLEEDRRGEEDHPASKRDRLVVLLSRKPRKRADTLVLFFLSSSLPPSLPLFLPLSSHVILTLSSSWHKSHTIPIPTI
jgi:hypothetical protein